VALTAGYEAIREASRRYEERLAENVKNATSKFVPWSECWRYWC
jgi:hypothetical protein